MNDQPITPDTDLQQLSRTVASLTEALARSERRHAHLARTMRWGALATVALVLFGGFLVAERIGIAHAQNAAGLPQAATTLEALNDINANLMVLSRIAHQGLMLSISSGAAAREISRSLPRGRQRQASPLNYGLLNSIGVRKCYFEHPCSPARHSRPSAPLSGTVRHENQWGL